ncbi:MAPEG family domain-containing protein [Penicillium angulare]|uniref:MAPEG family domain-containing protein n=1 Tax=Penicillium angulare TaxID=116970 RepID=A0A9W9KAB1_9EURO|nr:MAPEG family domain-containing protein [Penicillium angulare]
MPVEITIPDRYPFVLAAAVSTFFLNTFHSYRTSKLRESSSIQYPAAFNIQQHSISSSIQYPAAYSTEEQAGKDPKAFLFNCSQRAHANFTENLTPFLGSVFIAGLRLPTTTAILGGIWSASRAWYLIGYTSSGPPGRRARHFCV